MSAAPDLSRPADRLRFSRQLAGYKHAVDAWRALLERRLSARLYYTYESGERNLTYRNAVLIADKFRVPGVDAEWLMRGVGPGPALRDERHIPLESPLVPLARLSQAGHVLRFILDEAGRQPIDDGRLAEALGIIASLLDRHNVAPDARVQEAAQAVSRDVLDFTIQPLTMPIRPRKAIRA